MALRREFNPQLGVNTLHDVETGYLVGAEPLGPENGGVNSPIVPVMGLAGPWSLFRQKRGDFVGEAAFANNIGGGTWFQWDASNSRWTLSFSKDLIFDTTAAVGVASTSEQFLKQYTIPAGLLMALRSWSIKVLAYKSATAETQTLRVRLGSAGNATDANLGAAATHTSRSFALERQFFCPSTTAVRALASQGFTTAQWSNASLNVAYPQNVVVPDMATTDLFLTVSVTQSAAVEVPGIAHVILTGMA
jgi:hypothetical protein